MIEYYWRGYFQLICVQPILKFCQRWVSPTQLTCLSTIVGMCFIPLLLLQQPIYALCALCFSGYLDVLDGSLARAQGSASAKGAVLDIVSDRVVESAVILGLYWVDPSNRATPALLMLVSILLCITSFLVVGVFEQNDSEKSFHYSPGLIERAEAFLFFAAMVIWPQYFHQLSSLFIVLVLYTALKRICDFL